MNTRKPGSDTEKVIDRVRRAVELRINHKGGSILTTMRKVFLRHDESMDGLLG